MDTLRLMLLSLLIGATVSASPTYKEDGFQVNQTIIVQQQAQANPTPVILYVTPAPTSKPTSSTSSGSSSGSSTSGISRELYRGCEGDDVRAVQKLLKDLNYKVTVDGYFGNQTRNAVIQFQKNNSLSADGIVGSRTYRKLTSSSAVKAGESSAPRTTLSYGMRGDDVRTLQERLAYLGYYFDICSGNYLSNTRNAVRWFQQTHGLSVDGIAGPVTLSYVYSPNAIPAPPGPVYPTPTPAGMIFTRTLYQGMSGADVGYLQQLLKNLNYFTGNPTNFFGTSTYNAVRLFQSYNNLYVDGIAGTSTQQRLLSGKAIPYPGPTAKPSPSVKPSQQPGGETCAHCGQVIANNQVALHNTKAACGQHYTCQSGDHNGKQGCGHYQCAGSHQAGCGTSGHYTCDASNHAKLDCGHFACESGDHTQQGCGHWVCLSGVHTAACGKSGHYSCSGNHASLGLGCGHYQCDSGDHVQQSCGHWVCLSGVHTNPACAITGHVTCDGKEHAKRCTTCLRYACEGVPCTLADQQHTYN